MARRQCQATNKAGKPCGANPMRGEDWCNAHHPNAPESSRFVGGAKIGAGRPRNPRAIDVIRERLEADVDRVVKPLFDALDATSGITIAMKGGGSEFYETIDHSTRLRAVADLLDRSYGKPRQALEHSGPDGDPIHVVVPTDIEHAREVAEILAEAGAVKANGNGNSATNGHH